jgi:hypothetical protein
MNRYLLDTNSASRDQNLVVLRRTLAGLIFAARVLYVSKGLVSGSRPCELSVARTEFR